MVYFGTKFKIYSKCDFLAKKKPRKCRALIKYFIDIN